MFEFHKTCALVALTSFVAGAAPVASAEEDVKVPERFEHLDSVAAFDEVMATLQQARDALLTDATSEREAAEAMRFLLRTLSMSQDVSGDGFAHRRRTSPAWTRCAARSGGDNPDAEYDHVVWDGNLDYRRSRGNIGSVDHHLVHGHAARANFGTQQAPSATRTSRRWVRTRTATSRCGSRATRIRSSAGKSGSEDGSPGEGSILVRQYIGDRARRASSRATRSQVVGRERLRSAIPPSSDSGDRARDPRRPPTGFAPSCSNLHEIVSPTHRRLSPNRVPAAQQRPLRRRHQRQRQPLHDRHLRHRRGPRRC